jgi:THO complex subunit 5
VKGMSEYRHRLPVGLWIADEGDSHRYQQLPLIPTDEFLQLHPDHANDEEHDLTIARIEDERLQRLALEEQRQALLKRKEALTKETNGKKEELAKLDAEMEKWIAGQESVRKLFEAHVVLAETR